jgi:hypothetical protein
MPRTTGSLEGPTDPSAWDLGPHPPVGGAGAGTQAPSGPTWCGTRRARLSARDRASGDILNAMRRARWDPFAAAASALALIMLLVYLWVIRQQQDEPPAAWAVAALVVGAAAAGLGAVVAFPYRRAALAVAAVVLILLGLLAILTIGLPILVAGALCIVAGWRSRPEPDA